MKKRALTCPLCGDLPKAGDAFDALFHDCWVRKVRLGIDPGASGGMAAVVSSPAGRRAVRFASTPSTYKGVLDWLRPFSEVGDRQAALEWINPAIFGVGKASMAKLYGHYRALAMALESLRIPCVEVKPQVWERAFLPPRRKSEKKAAWKNRLKRKAAELYPDKKVTLATADALLLARYCEETYQ